MIVGLAVGAGPIGLVAGMACDAIVAAVIGVVVLMFMQLAISNTPVGWARR